MTREQIEKAAKKAVQNHFQCNGKYPCEERNYCEFYNGHNSAFDCKEDCSADDFNEGFIAGALWRINAAWHDPREEIPSCFKLLLLQDANGEIYLGYTLPPNITRWAYVSDLIPDEGKEGGQ